MSAETPLIPDTASSIEITSDNTSVVPTSTTDVSPVLPTPVKRKRAPRVMKPKVPLPSFESMLSSTPVETAASADTPPTTQQSLYDKIEELNQREPLLKQLEMYMVQFPESIKAATTLLECTNSQLQKKLRDSSVDDLQAVLLHVKTRINLSNTTTAINKMFFSSIKVLENTSQYTGLKLNGYSSALEASEEIDICLKELSCKYSSCIGEYAEPEYRLMFILLTTGAVIHAKNTSAEKVEKYSAAKVPKATVEKYKDL